MTRMNPTITLAAYVAAGVAGGLLGSRLRITGGAMIGAMFSVIALKALAGISGSVPRNFSVFIQILVGIVVGASYTQAMGRQFVRIIFPVIGSTLVLVTAGLLVTLVLVKTGVLDASTAYLGTSPGAMTALISVASDSDADLPVVLAFHFFRVVFIIVTAPLVFHVIRWWFPQAVGK